MRTRRHDGPMTVMPPDLRVEIARWSERQSEDRIAFGRLLTNVLKGRGPEIDPVAGLLRENGATAILARGELVRLWFQRIASSSTVEDLPQLNSLWPDAQRLAADIRLMAGEPGTQEVEPLPSRTVPVSADIAVVMTRMIQADPRACDRASVGAAAIVEQWPGHPLADDGLDWWRTVRGFSIVDGGTLDRWFDQMRLRRVWKRIRARLEAVAPAVADTVKTLLTTEEAATRAGVAVKTLNNWVHGGQVPEVCITGTGRARRFQAREFDRWLSHRRGTTVS